MYVIGHLYYLELTEKLPLHADARTRLFNQLPDYNSLDCLKCNSSPQKKILLFLHYTNCILHNTIHTVPWYKYL